MTKNLCTFIDDYLVDLGAQWIHGEKGNVVYELVAPLNITDNSKPYDDEVYTSTGELIDTRITKNLTDSYFKYLESIENITNNECYDSIGECFENKYEFRIVVPPLHECTQDKKILRQMHHNYLVYYYKFILKKNIIIIIKTDLVFKTLRNCTGKTHALFNIFKFIFFYLCFEIIILTNNFLKNKFNKNLLLCSYPEFISKAKHVCYGCHI